MEKFVEKVPIRGVFKMVVKRNGVLVEEYVDDNLIVNGARLQMAHLVAGDVAQRHVNRIAFGTSGVEPDVNDTMIANQYAKAISGATYPENGRVQFDWELLVTENNGMAILEFGLLTADGTLFARKTRTAPIYKESDISIEGHWTIIF
jgi:hypothetical protein